MKFEFNWPSGFRGEDVWKMLTEGRTTDARVIGILIAHLGAFGSGELKNEIERHLLRSAYKVLNDLQRSHQICFTFTYCMSSETVSNFFLIEL